MSSWLGHDPIPVQGRWLRAVVRGHLNYYGVPTNTRAIEQFREEVVKSWLRALRRRSQRHRMPWDRFSATTQGKSRVR
ncbi:MAG TPA: hypothetical protein PLN52_04065 [Opitutaceae bacterium]|nr:hypothetical protein [Opitutaceae bacterium]